MEITISDEQKELAKKAQEFSKKQQERQNDDSEVIVLCQCRNLKIDRKKLNVI